MMNLAGLLLYCLHYFATQIAIFCTLWFSNLARINVGVICVIWAITPLMIAIADYILFKQRLQPYHIIGMVLMVACALLLGMKTYIQGIVGEKGSGTEFLVKSPNSLLID